MIGQGERLKQKTKQKTGRESQILFFKTEILAGTFDPPEAEEAGHQEDPERERRVNKQTYKNPAREREGEKFSCFPGTSTTVTHRLVE